MQAPIGEDSHDSYMQISSLVDGIRSIMRLVYEYL